MKFYKILHKPTGLYYKPSRHGSPANLSKKGKVYERKPSLGWLGFMYTHPTPGGPRGVENRRVVASEWEVIEFKVEPASS